MFIPLPTEPKQIFVFSIHVAVFVIGSIWLFRKLHKMELEDQQAAPEDPHHPGDH